LDAAGYETPTPIQAATIPALLAGRDVTGLAQTGTGKTAAFALPILQRLTPDSRQVQALVLSPTRELALQVCEAFQTYAAFLPEVRVLPVYGGQGYGVQLNALAKGVQVVVGTPGRLIDHLEKGALDLSHLRYLVIDEADELLQMGFAEEIEKIIAATPDDKQVALFSATMPPAIRKLAAKYLANPLEFKVLGKTATAANVHHRYLSVAYPQKLDALTRILEVEDFAAMIVFVRTKSETETLAEKLRARGFSAAAINGDLPQQMRERTIEGLRSGRFDILVATDVAARGLDVERISHVVNFDIPTDTDSYVHRVGRTGRAGRSGEAISFVTPRERRLLAAIEKATRQTLTQVPVPSAEDVNAIRLTNFDSSITELLGSEQLQFFRDVVNHFVNEYDVPELDVAAALALLLQGGEPMLLQPDPEPVSESRKPRKQFPEYERGSRGERSERPRSDRSERREWSERPDRQRQDRSERREWSERPERRERSEYREHSEYRERPERTERREWSERPRQERFERERGTYESPKRESWDASQRESRERRPRERGASFGGDYTTYRIGLGKRQGISPKAIVGALAEQAGLSGPEFGRITIREHFSLVELPTKLPSRTWKALQSVHIGGQPISITLDQGTRGRTR
jgi:ATP-dependent RNA helicase DeaD